jgi:DNA-binding transcriptional LysR family regulator
MADRRLQVFHAVARLMSFTRAAEALCMTQPAVTFQVRQLEEQYNTRLFERSHGRIALTPTGQVVFEYADRILCLNEELDTRIGEMTGGVSGPLLLGASLTIAEFILPRILGEFKARYPDVRTRMTVANSESIENRVAEHALDVGLIESPSTLPGLSAEVCGEDELVVICAASHPFARRGAVTPQEVSAQPFISRESGSGTREFTDQYFRRAGVAPDDLSVVMELGSPEAIKGLVETGLGVSILSYAGGVQFGVIADRGLCPVPQQLIDAFEPEFDKLMLIVAMLPTEMLDDGRIDPDRLEHALFTQTASAVR